ncbi:MAG: YceI family protein [Chloroflexaceae bacterium]|nr:YceI family protein [Chloroflexaceae bacterium]
MKHVVLILLALSLVLVACGGGVTPAAQAPAEPAAEAPTEALTEAMEAPTEALTEAPTETAAEAPAAAAAEPVLFVIVPEESQVLYAVDETFLRGGVRDFTAVGVTQQIEGTITFDRANPQNSTVGPMTIDISAFQSDDERRDNAIRDRWLESARFPIATFTPTSIAGLPETYTDGDEITLQITGDLTIRDTTNPVTFETVGTINGDEMRGTATTMLLMTDFGFDPPDILNVLRAENEVNITFEFVARP